jgi:hypothetical protein
MPETSGLQRTVKEVSAEMIGNGDGARGARRKMGPTTVNAGGREVRQGPMGQKGHQRMLEPRGGSLPTRTLR